MELRSTIIIWALLLSLGSCYRESFSMCEDGNVLIGFSLTGDDGKEVFADNISAVNLFLFDEYGNYVMQKRVEKNELELFQGARLTLDPGKYKLVCWGNMNGNTRAGEDSEHYITYTGLGESGQALTDADRIFYGPVESPMARAIQKYRYLDLNVTDTGAEETVHFGFAHRVIEVNVSGFTDASGQKGLPVVMIEGIPLGLEPGIEPIRDENGDMLTVFARKSTEWIARNEKDYAWAGFGCFYFDLECDIVISVLDPDTGKEIYNIPLRDVLDEINLTDQSQITIPLVIEFIDGGVTISLPGWSSQNPGIGFGR